MRKNRGITLITLVITVIVLLIIAGVSIASLTGENGLIRRTKEAKSETEIADIKEEIERKVLMYIAKNGDITEDELLNIVKEYDKNATIDFKNGIIKINRIFNTIVRNI